MNTRTRVVSVETRRKISETRKRLFAEGKLPNWQKENYGSKSPYWKGGRHKGKNGYIRIAVDEYNPCGNRKERYEHRLIMEKILGRNLRKDEAVHHINGIKYDNRKENLVVISRMSNSSSGSPIKKILQRRIKALEKELRYLKKT